jgi:flagellar basal body rod protein FlgC
MRIESSFGLVDTAISAIQKQAERMRVISSDVGNTRTAVPEIVDIKSDRGAEDGFGSLGSRIDLNHLPVKMTNLNFAVQTYKANVGVLERYKQMTETKLELLG